MALRALSQKCLEQLAHSGVRTIAQVSENGSSIDLAVIIRTTSLAVVRCADRATVQHQTTLATMISEGDFMWGALVYEQGEAPHSLGLIESFHVSQLDQLVARLIELREACGEAG